MPSSPLLRPMLERMALHLDAPSQSGVPSGPPQALSLRAHSPGHHHHLADAKNPAAFPNWQKLGLLQGGYLNLNAGPG